MAKMYHYVCEQCKKEFDLSYKKRYEHIYCSLECAVLAKRKEIEKICPICERKFYVSPSNIDQKCCSKKCRDESLKAKPNYAKRKYKFLDTIAIENPIYKKWRWIKNRLFMPSCDRYKNYAERGITICKEWLDFENFYYWAINNGYKDGLSIERIDVNGNYEPSNCIWIPMEEQAKNRTTSIWEYYKGKKMILTDIAREEGVSPNRLIAMYHECNNNLSEALQIAHKNAKGLRRTNTSGYTGVKKNGKKWVVNRKSKYIGTFDTYEEAVEVSKTFDKKE